MDNQIPIRLQEPAASARRLLRVFRCRPHELERDAVALALRGVLEAPSSRDAVLQLIDRTFAGVPDDRGWRETIVRCDIRREKARAAASAMNLSLRQFYRRRSEAFEAIAAMLERVSAAEPVANPAPVLCARCRRELFGSSGDDEHGLRPNPLPDASYLRPSG